MSWTDMLIGVLKSRTLPIEEDLKKIATDVGTKLVSGELEPTMEVVKSYAKSRGLSDEDAHEFAVEALSAFFDADNDSEPVQKSESLHTISRADFDELRRAVDVIGTAVTFITKSLGSQNIVGEIEKLKHEIAAIGGQSANPRTPVEHAQVPVNHYGDRHVIKSKLLAGVRAGRVSVSDIGVFDIHNTLTDAAKAYLAENK